MNRRDDEPVDQDELERAFFGAAEAYGSGADPANDRAQRLLQPIVLALLLVLSALFAAQSFSKAAYGFTPREPLALGPAEDLRRTHPTDASGLILPSNRYVTISGVPERAAGGEGVKFEKLVGGHVYVATLRPDEPSGADQTFGSQAGSEDARVTFDGPGVVAYYAETYAVPFCGYDASAKLQAHVQEQRERAVLAGREPGAACVRGYLLIAGESPADAVPAIVGVGLWAIASLAGLVALARQLRRWFAGSRH
jgi:hypothetical protein